MILYHEANPDDLESILARGLKRTSRGDMGQGDIIIKTNQLLDRSRPQALRDAGVSRDNNIYAYLTTNTGLVDISTGNQVSESKKVRANHRALLRIEVTATGCYVSDLDAYDELKTALEAGRSSSQIHSLATQYWAKLIRLDRYKQGHTPRPEVMITYDVPPSHIEVISDT